MVHTVTNILLGLELADKPVDRSVYDDVSARHAWRGHTPINGAIFTFLCAGPAARWRRCWARWCCRA